MLWIHPVINIILWCGYITGTMYAYTMASKRFGGWHTLNFFGKATCIVSTFCAIMCAAGLVMTTPF